MLVSPCTLFHVLICNLCSHLFLRELSRFIAAGRLHCKVDKVGGIVETNRSRRTDSKHWQYQATVKQGDLLINRVQKLSRVINI